MRNTLTGHEHPKTATDLRTEVWYQFRQEIDDLLATGRYTWAIETLRGIQETVTRTQVVTDQQRYAVERIELGGRLGRWR